MSAQKDVIAAWQHTLEDAFQTNALLDSLREAEIRHSNEIATRGHGFWTLMRCYQEFALHTLEEVPSHGQTLNMYNLALNASAVKRFRASWLAYEAGYYFDAASGLRTIFEITTYLAAVLKGYFWFDELHGFAQDIDPSSTEFRDLKKHQHKHQQALAAKVRKKIYGDESGLSAEASECIALLVHVYHSHVHYGESNVFRAILKMTESGQMPSVAPHLNLHQASIFANPAVLTAWCHIRVLQYLSLPSRFSTEHKREFSALDSAFREYVQMWNENPPLKRACISLVDTSFTFDEQVAEKQITRDSKDGTSEMGQSDNAGG